MGCCETRTKFMTPADLENFAGLNISEQNTKLVVKPSFLLLIKYKKWADIVKLIGNTDVLYDEDIIIPMDPQPSTIGCLAITILVEASKDPSNKIHFFIKNSISTLVLNLTSDDKILKHYSYDLLESCSEYFTESIVHELISYGLFEVLCEISTKNTMIFSHKVFKNRERAQRMFLKHNGYRVVITCLNRYREDYRKIFLGIFDLLVDIKGKPNEYNCKHFFTLEFLKVLDEFKGEECENLKMLYEEFISRFY
ncbi:hypothetical protein SteCoe_24948 [Stentor coeruleus]|uniref:Uncharacterized protein n=1 Tax=Stentor coeruleus TaxID=5963 RepID=A0A1R2BGC0_9CILI|nr:hypothetical protein SteCoe_24948 [Stentor coeruleus]